MFSAKELEVRKEMMSDAKSLMNLVRKMEADEKEALDRFTGEIQSVINILDPQSYRFNEKKDREFKFEIDKFINAEGTIARSDDKTKRKIRFWRNTLIYVLGLKYQDPELIYLIILKYSSAYWDAFSEHTSNSYNLRDILLFVTIGMESEASLAFRDFMKKDVAKSFFSDLKKIKKLKKKTEVVTI